MQTLSFQITSALLLGFLLCLPAVPESRAESSVPEKDVLAAVEKVAPIVEEVGQKLWDLAEVSLLEINSSAYLKETIISSTGDHSLGHSHDHDH